MATKLTQDATDAAKPEYILLYRGEENSLDLRASYTETIGGENPDEGKWYFDSPENALKFADLEGGGKLYLLKVRVNLLKTNSIEERKSHLYDGRVFLVHDQELDKKKVDVSEQALKLSHDNPYNTNDAFNDAFSNTL